MEETFYFVQTVSVNFYHSRKVTNYNAAHSVWEQIQHISAHLNLELEYSRKTSDYFFKLSLVAVLNI
jgi:hypothetical protein